MEYSKEYLAAKAATPQKRRVARDPVSLVPPVVDSVNWTREDYAHHNKQEEARRLAAAPTPVEVKGKKVKHVLIEATFPELRGGKMYQSAHGEASGTKPAIARAFRELLKKVPGKRVSVIKATISITTKIVEG